MSVRITHKRLSQAERRPHRRFDTEPPTLVSIALDALQNYARHVGHLAVAVELADGDPPGRDTPGRQAPGPRKRSVTGITARTDRYILEP